MEKYMEKPISICSDMAVVSTEFEKSNNSLKKQYLIRNITIYNSIVELIKGNRGSFGTGYPFYALKKDLTGELPIIFEQIRYNNELVNHVINSSHNIWHCASCLSRNYDIMPDLKQICKPCPNMDNELKPRKVLNRLPDIDMWMVCDEKYIDDSKDKLIELLNNNNIHPSDTNPIRTMEEITKITENIANGIMPNKFLPIDAHIIDYDTLSSLIEKVPFELKLSQIENRAPFLPIHPLSYRKTWQKDDTAYNFIHDYLSSFTDFNFDDNMKNLLLETRRIIANNYSFERLYQFLIATGPDSVQRRHKTLELKHRFKERIDSWKD